MPQGISHRKQKPAGKVLKVPSLPPPGHGYGETVDGFLKKKEVYKKMARGDKPVIRKPAQTPPEGIPSEDSVLMEHPGKGKRWIPKELIEEKKRWGYKLVATKPVQAVEEKPKEGKEK